MALARPDHWNVTVSGPCTLFSGPLRALIVLLFMPFLHASYSTSVLGLATFSLSVSVYPVYSRRGGGSYRVANVTDRRISVINNESFLYS